MHTRLSAAQIESARTRFVLSDVIGKSVAFKRAGRRLVGICPFHNERTPSFSVDDERGQYHCFGCGAHGDLIDWTMNTEGLTFAATVERLLGDEATAQRAVTPAHAGGKTDIREIEDRRKVRIAGETWVSRHAITGTAAEKYLKRARGLQLRIEPRDLGYLHEDYCSTVRRVVPAMIAALRDHNGAVTAIQHTYLDLGTGDALRDDRGKRIKRTHGLMRDGAVRLSMPSETMGLAGSTEDALSAYEMFGVPVWAVCGENRLSRAALPSGIKRLVIFGDDDEAGRIQVEKAKVALARDDLVITSAYPRGCKDWNEYLQRGEAA